jgi:hypothetical protein
MTTMKPLLAAAALLSAVSFSARAQSFPGLDDSLRAPLLEPAPLQQRGYDDYPPRRGPYRMDARQGLLLSFGLGGGSLYLSNEGLPRLGAADVDFRLGYGFSDRFQMFMDFNADGATNKNGDSVGSWTWTVRGQTLLIGDRRGNGLNVNFGIGFGGLTYDNPYGDHSSGPTGLAIGGGLSFDARILPNLALSPELFFTWHQIPNGPAYADDVASIYGLRLNLLWYLR